MTEPHVDTVTPVTEEGRGAQIRARRERMGWSARAFATRAHLSRGALANLEADEPGVRETSYAQAERALDELAEELGFHEESTGGIIRVEIPSAYGGRAMIVQAPVENMDALLTAVERIMRRVEGEERDE